ncbi:hypothetical protein HMPREF1624_04614 [Sporothrix schenckii ATCC 58251]|uniref:Uncharacterized protein n=1 Tax=Sporothrix schenckii (strain ATCC 58251 / de Perez 2211183) TaxID=1391915 RepID=U7PXI1_SPOS1|nr:hypothetical protein HMPREF1624_04614 [Sporothrix schenckii ATCC 58251]
MPRTTSSPDEKRALLASRAEAQMASTNTTANAFLGTRQPSWLTANAKQRTAPTAGPPLTTDMARAVPAVAPAPGAPAAAPAAPPQAPAETRAPPLPTLNPADPKPVSTSTNLSQSDCSLLSPAPTDEASPAAASPDAIVPPAETTAEEVTHIHDFPSLRRALSEERQRRRAEKQMSTAPDTNAADDTPSEPRQPRISTNGAAPCQAQSDANSQEAAQHSRRQSLDVVAGAPPVDDRPQRVLPPNAPLATTMASSVSTGQVNLVPEEPSNTDPLPPTVPPEPATATEIAAAIAAATAKAAGGTNSGSTQATLEEQQNVYFPRTLVRTTTGNAEFSYVALAQLLLCLWLVDTAESHFQLAPLPSHLIDHSFGILQQILETNGQIRPTLLAWFSQFPGNIDDMIRHTSNYTQVIVQVRAFLERLALYWGPLSNSVAMRGYPLLVDELLSRLLCLSPTLQNLLSTASRKYLQPARDLGDTAFDEIFMKDLTQHQPALSTFIALPEPRFAEDLEWVNAAQQPPRQVAQIQQIRVPQTQEFQSIQQPQYAQQTFQRPLQQRVVDQNTSQAAAISPVLAESCLPVGAAYMAHIVVELLAYSIRSNNYSNSNSPI